VLLSAVVSKFCQLAVSCDEQFCFIELSEIFEHFLFLAYVGENVELAGKRSRAFRARISPSDNQAAERELRKELKSVNLICYVF